MKLIKLTSFNTKMPIYINVEMIGSLSEVEEKDFNRDKKIHQCRTPNTQQWWIQSD
jgi:hypothetical protein